MARCACAHRRQVMTTELWRSASQTSCSPIDCNPAVGNQRFGQTSPTQRTALNLLVPRACVVRVCTGVSASAPGSGVYTARQLRFARSMYPMILCDPGCNESWQINTDHCCACIGLRKIESMLCSGRHSFAASCRIPSCRRKSIPSAGWPDIGHGDRGRKAARSLRAESGKRGQRP